MRYFLYYFKVELNLLPSKAGVYLMRSATGDILYIGKAKNLRKRVAQYFKGNYSMQAGWKIPNLAALVKKIDYIPCVSERDALILERRLISEHKPFFNAMWKDDKSYPYLKITVNEDFPRIFLTRKKISDGAVYLGPYPKTSAIKNLIGYLWRIGFLPLRQCRWDFSLKKPLSKVKINSCLYFHTGQCPAPCAGKISKKAYKAIAQRAVMIFEGKFEKLKKQFTRQMKENTKKLNYEESARYRDFLSALEHISEKVLIGKYKGEDLAKILQKTTAIRTLSGILKLKNLPVHIEAFDTSHLFAKEPVGAMVCFIDGSKNHSHYRRFKIKTEMKTYGADDYAMIEEIVSRRLEAIKISGESPPDLILIDGGKGQLSSAISAVERTGLKIPVISLAKRKEEIFTPNRAESIILSKSNPALKLLMEIRDEVHRFAITYHRKLRTKKLQA